jgi:hypothetical protein
VISTGRQDGFALLTMMVLLALLMGLLLTHFSLTWIELSTTRSSMNSFVGFYAAEAGLNVRADLVRQDFVGYSLPSGTSPDTSGGATPCVGSNQGSGDFACVAYAFRDRKVISWVEETPYSANPIVVPRGEKYKNLHGHEYHYVVYSNAINAKDFPEAVLEMHFKSRVVPLFQFAAFYDKDLEILPWPDLFLEGPVHSNGDLYVGSNGTLDIMGQLTVADDLFHGRKDADLCMSGDVQVADPDDQTAIPGCSGGRTLIAQSDVTAWNGMINTDVTPLTLPPPEALDPVAGRAYWDSADVRIVLDVNGAPAIQVRDANGSVNVADSATLNACGVVAASKTFYDNREGELIDMLDVDVQGLLTCLHNSNLMGYDIDDTTDGGLVWHLTVDGPASSVVNNYGVRLTNGNELVSPAAGSPAVAGLTVATDQAMYVQGHFNAVNKIPAAVLADSLNVLSDGWSDDANSALPLATNRVATATTINAAFLTGTDTTGGAEGAAGRDSGGYNGGLENFFRLHEKWTGVTLTYRGSFVSLDNPRHVDGAWTHGAPYYTAPARDWNFDLDFEDALLMPPLSPVFVYLRQELFVRRFEL